MQIRNDLYRTHVLRIGEATGGLVLQRLWLSCAGYQCRFSWGDLSMMLIMLLVLGRGRGAADFPQITSLQPVVY